MKSPGQQNSLTPAQQHAVEARRNVLVMAGAGTGKTATLVARCLDCLERDGAQIDELLIVTFTEAAAAEMRQRLRRAIESRARSHSNAPPPASGNAWNEQLARFDLAHIGTLHSFCLKLVRERFYELGLDPQMAMLDEGEARQRAAETMSEQFAAHYAGTDDFSRAVQELIEIYGGGRDEHIRRLILRLHHYSQARPEAADWLEAERQGFSQSATAGWQKLLLAAMEKWREEWLPVLKRLKADNEKAGELAEILSRLPEEISREAAAEALQTVISADETANYPQGRAETLRAALGGIFNEARFLASLAKVKNGVDPLAEDWSWARAPMEALLRLAQEFGRMFSARKRADGVLDFHDLEQFALKLLWDFSAGQPTAVAKLWRRKLRFVFVDEYQDINAAQNQIIAALSRDGAEANRFLVGDVKQSIYQFRLADPTIFRDYARTWREPSGQTIPLRDNFRSRESLLRFVNSFFAPLMRAEVGGVAYDEQAQLKFGQPDKRKLLGAANDASPRAELLLRFKTGNDENTAPEDEPAAGELADLSDAEKEARMLAARLKDLRATGHEIWDEAKKDFRPAEWRDMAVLLRAPSGKAEIYAMVFEAAGVPLKVARGGFYESPEILDVLSLLQLLDNPLQDVPCIAVLRSPLVGCSLDELAEIRLAARGHFWFALNQALNPKPGVQGALRGKAGQFLERFARWRKLARRASLTRCLEAVLAETHYDDWLRSRPRSEARQANLGRLLHLADQFDRFQRQGLYRFLQFIEAQREAESEPEPPVGPDENAVQLMSIHQSKGREFPVVAVADLGKRFNVQDLRGEIILDEKLGLCPRVKPPGTNRRYPSLTYWLAQRHQRRELAGEELRLLYVAMTRARDTLLLAGTVAKKKWETGLSERAAPTERKISAANSYADWLGLWFASQPGADLSPQGELPEMRWKIVPDGGLAGNPEIQNSKSGLEWPPLDDMAVEKLRKVFSWQYPHEPATRRKAKSSVTELRRQAEETDDEAEPVSFSRFRIRTGLSAAETGAAHHKFLQHLPLGSAGDPAALETAAGTLEQAGILSPEERQSLDLSAIAAFWNSAVGRQIQGRAANVKRELEFTAKFSPEELGRLLGNTSERELKDEFVVVQGVADLVVLLPAEIWLVDFKTDAVNAGELDGKIKTYSPQLRIYANALQKIYSRPVANCWLHFLAARRTGQIQCGG